MPSNPTIATPPHAASNVTRDIAPLYMRARIEPSSVNDEARTVDVEWTTGAPVLRGYFNQFWEELSLDPKHVRMTRINSGAPFLDTHDGFSALRVFGVVIDGSARLEKKRGVATVRFDTAENDPDADKIFRKIKSGIVRNVSVGYRVYRMEKVEGGEGKIPTFRATDWEPYEISAVPMGADDGAGFRAAEDRAPNACTFINRTNGSLEMSTIASEDAPIEPTTGAAQMRALITASQAAVRMGFPQTRADALLSDTAMTPERFRETVFAELAARDDGGAGNTRISGGDGDTLDNPDFLREALSDAVARRAVATFKPRTDAYRQFMSLGFKGIARSVLEARGVRTQGMSDYSILVQARGQRGFLSRASVTHSTSDLPLIFADALNKGMRAAYEEAPADVLQIGRQTTAADFRPKHTASLDVKAGFEPVSENGEWKRNSQYVEARESFAVERYADGISVSEKMQVNDDMDALTGVIRMLGSKAREKEVQLFVGMLTANSGVGPTMSDGNTLFHASHGNVATPATLSVDEIGEARTMLRLQKGLGGAPIAVAPKYLLVPATLETTAEKMLAQIAAAKADDVNPFSGKLTLLTDARLDAISSTAWYLSAPAGFGSLEYATLEGEDGPIIDVQEGWDVFGFELRCKMSFGCGAIDWRGLVRNAGA